LVGKEAVLSTKTLAFQRARERGLRRDGDKERWSEREKGMEGERKKERTRREKGSTGRDSLSVLLSDSHSADMPSTELSPCYLIRPSQWTGEYETRVKGLAYCTGVDVNGVETLK
jgi:hypothetical protein